MRHRKLCTMRGQVDAAGLHFQVTVAGLHVLDSCASWDHNLYVPRPRAGPRLTEHTVGTLPASEAAVG